MFLRIPQPWIMFLVSYDNINNFIAKEHSMIIIMEFFLHVHAWKAICSPMQVYRKR